jgi:transcriptional regulator with XRE-family HTH domain
MDLKSIIAMNLKYYRFKAGKTQEQYYENANLNFKYMAQMENGKVNATIEFLENAASSLNLKVTDLLTYNKNHYIKKSRIDSRE